MRTSQRRGIFWHRHQSKLHFSFTDESIVFNKYVWMILLRPFLVHGYVQIGSLRCARIECCPEGQDGELRRGHYDLISSNQVRTRTGEKRAARSSNCLVEHSRTRQ